MCRRSMPSWGASISGPAPEDYLNQVAALDPDVIIPMHCSGDNFARAVRAQLLDKLLVSTTGVRLTMGA
jgi:7,8-dihydropterin-6-yl-methyl-4-(beta-D-ribofuranosyl)aminobenzene 5'-phosphate synthase